MTAVSEKLFENVFLMLRKYCKNAKVRKVMAKCPTLCKRSFGGWVFRKVVMVVNHVINHETGEKSYTLYFVTLSIQCLALKKII